jgi:hypothetical protein
VIVTLTSRQLEVCGSVGSDIHRAWLREATKRVDAKSTFEVLMPAIGWRQMLGLLEEFTIGPDGGNRRDAKRSALNARKRIARRLVEYEAHPALRGIAVEHPSTLALPVWPRVDGEFGPPFWSIYPTAGLFVVLWPRREEWNGMMVTIWEPALPISHESVLSEQAHLDFVVG